jgi:hypothetical protein
MRRLMFSVRDMTDISHPGQERVFTASSDKPEELRQALRERFDRILLDLTQGPTPAQMEDGDWDTEDES